MKYSNKSRLGSLKNRRNTTKVSSLAKNVSRIVKDLMKSLKAERNPFGVDTMVLAILVTEWDTRGGDTTRQGSKRNGMRADFSGVIFHIILLNMRLR